MPRLKPTPEELSEREKRAVHVKEFMSSNLFTEKKLAEALTRR